MSLGFWRSRDATFEGLTCTAAQHYLGEREISDLHREKYSGRPSANEPSPFPFTGAFGGNSRGSLSSDITVIEQ